MGIKRVRGHKSNAFFFIILFSLCATISLNLPLLLEAHHNQTEDFPEISMVGGDSIVVDKVYNFTVQKPYVIFDNNIALLRFFNYYITVWVVTPHSCSLKITLVDFEDDRFDLAFHKNMTQDDYRTIPFGVVIPGNYSMNFTAILNTNLNIHIRIKRDEMCLLDKISVEELPDMIYYNVSKFTNGSSVNHHITLKTDWYYKFYFERVSPISDEIMDFPVMDHYLTSSGGMPYMIYENVVIEGPCSVNTYRFGTAIAGNYTFNISVYCEVDAVNVAYVVIELEQIADGTDPNNPDSDLPPNNNTQNNTQSISRYFIPKEWTSGIVIFGVITTGLVIVLVEFRKRKNIPSRKLK